MLGNTSLEEQATTLPSALFLKQGCPSDRAGTVSAPQVQSNGSKRQSARELESAPKRKGLYLQQSVGKFKPKGVLKNMEMLVLNN